MRASAAALAALLLGGCQLGYYTHLVRGEYALLSQREPIDELIARPGIRPELRDKLRHAQAARRFAVGELGLPDNGSYTSYVDLQRPYAVWNVFAAPELSLEAHEWCYPFLGCMAYRGYYASERAETAAAELREEGLETYVAGVAAYSTLGWFDDPLLSTIGDAEEAVAGTIFHELAHQVAFADGDTAFNESFATFVEQEGLRRYLKESPRLERARRRQQREAQFIELMLGSRARLEVIYVSGDPPDVMRAGKRRELARLRREYEQLKQDWGGDGGYDRWFAGELDNARLLPFGLYRGWVPAFAALFREQGESWPAFYREVSALAEIEPAQRGEVMKQLGQQAAG